MTADQSNGRTWTPVVSVLALITGVAAVVSPIGFGIVDAHNDIAKLEVRMSDGERDRAAMKAELAAIRIQFAEVETQISWVKDQLASVDIRIELRLNALDKTLQQEIKNVSDLNAILQTNQRENIAAVQDIKVRQTAVETYLKFGRNPLAKPPGTE